MRKFLASLLEVFEIAIIAIGSVFLVRSFLVQPFLVSGSSMAPNFQNGDYLLVDELTYRFRSPERGEVIVFRYPKSPSTYFIKRIIGLPGETVEIQDNRVRVLKKQNGEDLVLHEEYLPAGTVTAPQGASSYTLGPNEYFVMGDNRSFSFDSRSWGPVPASDIVGLARLRLWPLDELHAFAAPQYPPQ